VFTLMPMITGRGREHHGEILRAAATLVEAGRLVPRMDARRFSLGNALAAHALVEAGGATGKAVVDVVA
jgi:NADPH:quinone reductase-like Zn-dependent oxidoreductase